MLACGTAAMGVKRYCCAFPDCTHSRFFCQSCKSKGCSSCGHKATEQWVSQQSHILLDCDWQHITFTMPHLLWPFFNSNWPLLNALFRTATRGGLDIKHGVWRDIFFKKQAVEEIWRGAVIRLLRHSYDLINPGSLPVLGISAIKNSGCAICRLSTDAAGRCTSRRRPGAWRSVKYLGRYLKRPPVSAAKLRHYSGGAVVHHYYDHRTQQYRKQTLSQEEMIGRYISNVPAKDFKMVRYYDSLSSRKRGELLAKVYEALQMEARKKPDQPGFAALMKGLLGTDPYKCILCGNRLRFTGAQAGSHASELVAERQHNIDRKRWLLSQTAG